MTAFMVKEIGFEVEAFRVYKNVVGVNELTSRARRAGPSSRALGYTVQGLGFRVRV